MASLTHRTSKKTNTAIPTPNMRIDAAPLAPDGELGGGGEAMMAISSRIDNDSSSNADASNNEEEDTSSI